MESTFGIRMSVDLYISLTQFRSGWACCEPEPLRSIMLSNGGGTGIFFVIALGCIGLFLMYWLWAVHNRRNQQRMLGFPSPTSQPQPHPRDRSPYHSDPVVRMEAGENTDGLPKYTPQAAIGEQTVDRNVAGRLPSCPADLHPRTIQAAHHPEDLNFFFQITLFFSHNAFRHAFLPVAFFLGSVV
ncbi:hypothetical protein OPQ81_006791 [Rhizoctonia solani]|nr:hypothetical protein OPQ81_006791 [Rhizoctonia solani]